MNAKQHRVTGDPRGTINKFLNVGVALTLFGALVLTAPVPTAAHSIQKSLPTLRLPYLSAISLLAPTLDPALTNSNEAAAAIGLTNANLVRILPTGKVVPDLARWTVSKDQRVYTFTIRSNARFSNGHPVTAHDAEFSLKRTLAPSTDSPVASYLSLIRGADAFHAGTAQSLAGVRVLSSRVIQITITKPAAYFLGTLSYPTGDVLDPTIVAASPIGIKADNFKTNYLTNTCVANQGAGPFRFVCRNGSSNLHSFYAGGTPTYSLAPNPYYYGRRPLVRIELPGYSGSDLGYKQYLAGKLDASYVPSQFLIRWKGRSSQYHEFPSSIVRYLMPNTLRPPFDDVHCRLAVAYAMDRNFLASGILGPLVNPTYAVVPPGMLGYYPGTDNPHYSVAKARSELAKCSGRTIPFVLKYPAVFDNAFAFIKRSLQNVGMNVKLKRLSGPEYGQVVSRPLEASGTQLIFGEWQQDYPDPQDYCTLFLRSGAPVNLGSWHNATYDGLVDRADVESNSQKRAQLYIRAQHLALSQGAFISLVTLRTPMLIKPYVHGLIGTEAYLDLVPKNLDWANVTISPH